MALRPVYEIEGRRWVPVRRAAELLRTSTATVKRMMGDGTLDWRQLRANSKTLLVEERGVMALRLSRGTGEKDRLARANAATLTADRRGRSMTKVAAASERLLPGKGPGVFEPTWDPAPQAAPVAGREEGTGRG